jgi:hypothetical protein
VQTVSSGKAAALLPGGHILVAENGEISVEENLEAKPRRRSLGGYVSGPIALSADGARAAVPLGQEVAVLDLPKLSEVARLRHDSTIRHLAFGPTGGAEPWLVTAEDGASGGAGVVNVWRFLDGEVLRRIELRRSYLHGVAVDDGGRIAVTADASQRRYETDAALYLLQPDGSLDSELPCELRLGGVGFTVGACVAVVDSAGALRLVDAERPAWRTEAEHADTTGHVATAQTRASHAARRVSASVETISVASANAAITSASASGSRCTKRRHGASARAGACRPENEVEGVVRGTLGAWTATFRAARRPEDSVGGLRTTGSCTTVWRTMAKRAGVTSKVSLSVHRDDLEILKRRAKRLYGGNVSAVFAELIATIKRQEAWGKAVAWYGKPIVLSDEDREGIDRELLREGQRRTAPKKRQKLR